MGKAHLLVHLHIVNDTWAEFYSICEGGPTWLGQNNPYTGFLEARIKASNKERMYELVRPNHPLKGGGMILPYFPVLEVHHPSDKLRVALATLQ